MRKLLLMLLAFVFITACSQTTATVNYDDFAKCLTEKGAAMYGASWCGHCANQKEMFGTAIKFINYVECDTGSGQLGVCAQAGIRGYPTWLFKNGQKIEGEASVVDLSKASGCDLELIKA